jgi:hypothetical protein
LPGRRECASERRAAKCAEAHVGQVDDEREAEGELRQLADLTSPGETHAAGRSSVGGGRREHAAGADGELDEAAIHSGLQQDRGSERLACLTRSLL